MVPSRRMTERGKHHTIEEWLALPSDKRLEFIDGEFIEKAAADVPHALAQAGALGLIQPAFHRKPRGPVADPGSWWIASEVDIQLGENGFRPDIAGWLRARSPEPPGGSPVMLRPDWICEVLSDSLRPNAIVRKLRRYHQAGLPHYWLLDPETSTLNVFRHEPLGYLNVLIADRPQRVRAEPFDSIEIHVGSLLGDDAE